MMQQRRISIHKYLTGVFVLLFVCAFLLTGCQLQPASDPTQPTPTDSIQSPTDPDSDSSSVKQFQQNLYGALVDADGQILENVELSVTGSVRQQEDGSDLYNYRFDYPENCSYQVVFDTYSGVPDAEQSFYYRVLGIGQKKGEDDVLLCYVGADVENQCMIVDWNDNADVYLIVSADANADAAQLWQHFQGFIENLPEQWPEVSVG